MIKIRFVLYIIFINYLLFINNYYLFIFPFTYLFIASKFLSLFFFTN